MTCILLTQYQQTCNNQSCVRQSLEVFLVLQQLSALQQCFKNIQVSKLVPTSGMAPSARGLKFCPETNDLLYPRENKETRKLEYYCKNCMHVEPAGPQDYCVYVNETTFSAKDKTMVLQDVIADPTLPRTKDVRCPNCNHNEAVFISANTESGMTLYFNCTNCSHRWRDYV